MSPDSVSVAAKGVSSPPSTSAPLLRALWVIGEDLTEWPDRSPPEEAATTTGAVANIGSVLLIPELLTKPMRDGADTGRVHSTGASGS